MSKLSKPLFCTFSLHPWQEQTDEKGVLTKTCPRCGEIRIKPNPTLLSKDTV